MVAKKSADDSMTPEDFFKWLLAHRNCILEVQAGPVFLADTELLHWDLFEEDGRCVVQLLQGKALVGEVGIELAEIAFVQPREHTENPGSGQWVFECMGGSRTGSAFPMFGFIMNHGLVEAPTGHQGLKH